MDAHEVSARAAIQATVARYTFHGDRGNVAELAQCFAEDGVLDFTGEWVAHGRDGIFEQTSSVTGDTRERVQPLLRHHLATHYVEFEGTAEARATTYFTAYTEIGPDHVGRYVDRLRREGDDWLFAHRRILVDWWAPNTLYPGEAERSAARRSAAERE
jgi:hypothetical protein